MCKCLIIDNSPVFCSGLKKVLLEIEKFKIVEESHDTNSANRMLDENEFDLVFIDMNSASINVSHILKRIISNKIDCKLVFISTEQTASIGNIAMKYNVDAYIAKSESIEKLVTVINSVLHGFKVIPKIYSEIGDKDLSVREVDVLRFLLSGHSNKDIARKLSLSPKTVSTYKKRALIKYKVNNVIELSNLFRKDSDYSNVSFDFY